MAKNFKMLRDKMSLERQKRIKKMADKEMQKIVISQMRKFVDMTQAEPTENFDTSQTQLESTGDMQLSTFAQMINSLGGELEIIVHMPNTDIRIARTA
ncbi:putative XRE family transcriptional regulator [Candidatus Magnetomoraceae bacterium gMMP-13]